MEQTDQLREYLPVLMLGAVAVAFSFGMLILSVLLGQKGKRSKIKDTAYECGMLPIGEGTARMSVKFYLVAMLFILFDIEVVFLYPWAVIYKSMLKENAAMIFGSMMSFLLVLFIGNWFQRARNASFLQCALTDYRLLITNYHDQIWHIRLAWTHRQGFYIR